MEFWFLCKASVSILHTDKVQSVFRIVIFTILKHPTEQLVSVQKTITQYLNIS